MTRDEIDAAVQRVLFSHKLHPAVIDHERAIYRAAYVAGMRASADISVPRAHTCASENADRYIAFDDGARYHSTLIRAAADRIEQEQA